ncbi:MAG: bacterioferritin [Pseudomonadota bacterium]|nr:bacterioferritin [Pseudomonadota bacterium]MDE3038195.1 bacterioferritin [Pseudomonadota bacterium]
MIPDSETIVRLNAVLKAKLTGINQYFLHARLLKHRGEVRLADYEYKASLGAMKHADMLVEQVLSLGGAPSLQELDRLSIGDTAPAMLESDLALAEHALTQIETALAHCESREDSGTAAVLAKILDSQREHIACLHKELNPLIKDCA